jgi:hypothetical protein
LQVEKTAVLKCEGMIEKRMISTTKKPPSRVKRARAP